MKIIKILIATSLIFPIAIMACSNSKTDSMKKNNGKSYSIKHGQNGRHGKHGENGQTGEDGQNGGNGGNSDWGCGGDGGNGDDAPNIPASAN